MVIRPDMVLKLFRTYNCVDITDHKLAAVKNKRRSTTVSIAASKRADSVWSCYGCDFCGEKSAAETHDSHQIIKHHRSALRGKNKWCVNIQGTIFIIDSPFNDYVLCNSGS